MISKRLGGLCAAAGLALGLGACVDDYGYGGVQVGYGNTGYYGDPYYDGYGGYGYGAYGPSYYGWYGNYFYPGTGIYVYDQYRRPYRWNDSQRRYWSNQQRYRGRDWNGGGNWNGFDRTTPNRGYDGNRQWQQNQGGDRSRQWQQNRGNDGNRQWQRNRNDAPAAQGYQGTPGAQRYRRDPGAQGYRSAPGAGTDATRTFTPPAARSSGQWQGRADGAGRGSGQWQGRGDGRGPGRMQRSD